ncbi:MAG: tetratricopeptide repeat protein [Planctomycetes bacterium]|nr:tetratricopeptide repeat protein [Planctomycetota bacterium]
MNRTNVLALVLGIELAAAAVALVRHFGGREPLALGELALHFNQSDALRDVLPAEHARCLELVESNGRADDWFRLVSFYLTIGYYPEAEYYARRACERWPGRFDLSYTHAICLDVLGRVDEAITAFEAANAMIDGSRGMPAANDHRCWFFIGRNELRRDDPEAALRAFQRARRFPPVVWLAARTLAKLGRWDDVATLLPVLTQVRPDAYEVALLQARLAEARGDATSAERDYARSDSLMPRFGYDPVKQALQHYREHFMGR